MNYHASFAPTENANSMLPSVAIDEEKLRALSAKERWALADALNTTSDLISGLTCQPRMNSDNSNNYNGAGELLEELNEFIGRYREAIVGLAKADTSATSEAEEWRWWTVIQYEASMTDDLGELSVMVARATADLASVKHRDRTLNKTSR